MRKLRELRNAFSCALFALALIPTLSLAASDSPAMPSATVVKAATRSSAAALQITTVQSPLAPERHKRDDMTGQASIAVIYPQIEEPFHSIFSTIRRGIESQSTLTVRSYVLADTNLHDLNAVLKKNGTRGVIVLGRKGFQAIDSIDKELPILVGGILSVPENPRYSLISLSPNPRLLFERMKALSAQVRRIYVVHNPKQAEAQIRSARAAAKELGLELIAVEASDISTAARHYEATMRGMDGRTDALWLPDDSSTLNNNIILPRILERSWNQNIPVFSSTVAHVARGVLFSMHPDHYRMGQTLAQAMSTMVTDKGQRYHEGLSNVRIIINERTARHLGLPQTAHSDSVSQ